MTKPKKKAASKEPAKAKTGKCYFDCGTDCDDNNFCHGCHQFVCEDCDNSGASLPFGGHHVDAHIGVDDGEEEDE